MDAHMSQMENKLNIDQLLGNLSKNNLVGVSFPISCHLLFPLLFLYSNSIFTSVTKSIKLLFKCL